MKAELGKRHRMIRESVLGQNVADYATTMGVKEVTVYSWESGRTAVPQEVLAILEERHGISAGWMLTGKGDMHVSDGHQAGRSQSPLERVESHLQALRTLVDELRANTPTVVAGAKRRSRGGHVRIPLLSLGVSAGTPTVADDTVEREIDLAEMLLEHPDSTYFIRVVGDSMTGAGIHDGDTLIVDCAIQPRPGQVVIARVYGELTVKRYAMVDGVPILRAENTRHRDIEITPDMDFTIVGVVRSCIKTL
ncbi:MAG TPA: hypothetical protein DIS79_03940 [Bacteroidetes bacterium]|nr:hypothetical protein [Bacteroidota bacterium]HRK06037.1 translesion error-prone DNA polymerase V autoproteolytic subunit [Chlorobiota bacterium]